MIEHNTEITIPFHDVDMMRITWHGHYVRYLEIARCELLDLFGYGYDAMFASGYSWPIIDMHLRYSKSCAFGDRINIRSRIVETEFRLKIDYLISNASTGQKLTSATTTQVAVEMDTGQMCYPCPNILAERIAQYEANQTP